MSAHAAYAAAAAYTLLRPESPRLLLLLHGLGGDRRQPLALLGDADWPGLAVLAPDARAHGDTAVIGGAGDFAFPALAADLLALVRALGQAGKPTYLAGISMGAGVALRAALAGGLDVRGLALIRPSHADEALPPHLRPLLVAGEFLARADGPPDVAAFERAAAYRAVLAASAAGAASLRGQLLAPQARERRIRLDAVPRNLAYADPAELAAIGVPTLLIGAERDPAHPLAVARAWAEAIPRAELLVAPPRDDDPRACEAAQRAALRAHLQRALGRA